ncbi:MAG: deoxyribonuclease IV [Bacilli bacterium]
MSRVGILGAHVSLSAPGYFLDAVQTMIAYEANTMMFYTGPPQNARRIPVEQMMIEEGKKLLEERGISPSHLIVHAPYIINIGNTIKPELALGSKELLREELNRTAAFGAEVLVLHPGAHVGAGKEVAIAQIIEILNDILGAEAGPTIALETMAGKGSEIGSTFEELAMIIAGVHNQKRIGVCLDTCHIHDAGYDVADLDGILKEFDEVIGLEYLRVLHINDSKNERGARKDRHDNLGYGKIGFETLLRYVTDPRLAHISKILETPYIGENPPYAQEIAMLKSGSFDAQWRENFIK